MLLGLVAALAAASMFGFAAVLLAAAAQHVPPSSGLHTRLLRGLLREPRFLAAVALSLIGFLLHVVALRLLPLFLAQAAVSLSLAVTAVLAVRLLEDHLSGLDWAGVAAQCVGLVLLASAAGREGSSAASPELSAALVVAVVVIAVGGVLLSRWTSRFASAVLGFFAGLAFAAVSFGARVLPLATPTLLWRAPSAYTVAVSGLLGFLLYSLALQRRSVTAATAPMILAQTVTPAALGVVVLHDAVRPGLVPAALLGGLFALVGATALARMERTHPATGDAGSGPPARWVHR